MATDVARQIRKATRRNLRLKKNPRCRTSIEWIRFLFRFSCIETAVGRGDFLMIGKTPGQNRIANQLCKSNGVKPGSDPVPEVHDTGGFPAVANGNLYSRFFG